MTEEESLFRAVDRFMDAMKQLEQTAFLSLIDIGYDLLSAYQLCYDKERDHNIRVALLDQDYGRVSEEINENCDICPCKSRCEEVLNRYYENTDLCSDVIQIEVEIHKEI